MAAESSRNPRDRGWTIERAEQLLGTLTGVLSVRVVAKPGGEIEEIHVLTTDAVTPKQTVRNVESALLAQLDLEVDHRVISVAQTTEAGEGDTDSGAVLRAIPPGVRQDRILFVGHETGSERTHHLTIRVSVEWDGDRYEGEASGTDLPRSRLETVANATLRAVEAAVGADADENETEEGDDFTLALDGVKVVDAFDRSYALVAVHAITGRDVTPLAGSAGVTDAPDRAVILATLQATDRWVRGRA